LSIESSILKFSGHQTFPIRYGWIYKIIQEVIKGNSLSSKDNIEDQMTSMGMGKNMVLSVRHWIRTLNLVECTDKKTQTYRLTELAEKLFVGGNAFDEYLDNTGTVWLLHWLMQSIDPHNAELNTARWFFNYFNGVKVDKLQLAKDILQSLENHEKELAEATLKKDIDCVFQMYAVKTTASGKVNEDSFTSPFTELGLILQESAKDYRAELSLHKSLPTAVFGYALINYMMRKQLDSNGKKINNNNTLSFDSLLNDVGSPGRVFRLTTSGLSEKLDELEILSKGNIAWTDTQGLRQVQHNFDDLQSVDPAMFLENYYHGE
jgi:arginine repressor